jgi:hypothetical protein
MSTVIGAYGWVIPLEDQIYDDLEKGITDIVTIPFTNDDIFKGDVVTFFKEFDTNVSKSYEIIGQVYPVQDDNGNYIEKMLHVKKLD